MTSLRHRAYGDILVPLVEECSDDLDWPKSGAFPLFPYHGRLRGAELGSSGQVFRLRGNPHRQGDAMHGPSQRRSWTIEQRSYSSLLLSIDYQADDEWPFSFKASQFFSISDQRLDVSLSLSNTSDRPAPGGIGWHPYFTVGAGVEVRCDAKQVWTVPAAGAELAPFAEARDDPSLGSNPQSRHLSNWSRATFTTPAGRVSLLRRSALEFLVLHRTGSYLCLEPVSHLSGAPSLSADLRSEAGFTDLAPGQMKSGKLSILVGR